MIETDDGSNRFKYIILGLGLMLLGGATAGVIWHTEQRSQSDLVEEQAPKPPVQASAPVQAPGGTAAGAGSGQGGARPTAGAGRPAGAPPGPGATASAQDGEANQLAHNGGQPSASAGQPVPRSSESKYDSSAISGVPARSGIGQSPLPAGEPLDGSGSSSSSLSASSTQASPSQGGTRRRFRAVAGAEAAAHAAQTRGRTDPMDHLAGEKPFPLHSDRGKSPGGGSDELPPPPPVAAKPASDALDIPKPPPSQPSLVSPPDPLAGLPLDQLPLPPEKPSIAEKLKLTALIGNKAMFVVPFELRSQNNYPKVICLGPGEQFESINVVSVDNDSVTLDEDGERSVKTLPPVR